MYLREASHGLPHQIVIRLYSQLFNTVSIEIILNQKSEMF